MNIFSVHRTELLENKVDLIVSEEKFLAQRIVLTNSKVRKTDTKVVSRNEAANIEIVHNIETAAKKYINEENIQQYITKKFGKSIQKLEMDFDSNFSSLKLFGKFFTMITSEKGLVNVLKEYYFIPESINTTVELMQYIEESVKKYVQEFLKKQNLSEMAVSIDFITEYYQYRVKKNLIDATSHFTDILYDIEKHADRNIFFDDLYEKKLILGGKLKGYYECVECSPNTFNGLIQIDLKPSKLNINCPKCKEELLYIVPYEINEDLYKDIISPDGLLFHAIQHLLDKTNILYKKNEMYLEDVEIDFTILNDKQEIEELYEIKMFKLKTNETTQQTNLLNTVSQFKKALSKLIKKNIISSKIENSIITNISDLNIINEVNKLAKDDLRQYNINIYTMESFKSELARKSKK